MLVRYSVMGSPLVTPVIAHEVYPALPAEDEKLSTFLPSIMAISFPSVATHDHHA